MSAVTVRGLTVRFGSFEALRELSLELPEASILAVLGPNGSGKSTLLRVLLGLLPPTAGEVLLFDRPAAAVPPEWLGYVPQVKTLDRSFPALALELVVNGLRRGWPGRTSEDDRRRATAALDAIGAGHLAGRALGGLSGGELQRVYLARALVRSPRLLLLDEPTTGIDTVGETDMYRLLERYHAASGATVVMVTHDWEAAYHHATHVLVLSAARAVGFGRHDEVLTDQNLRRAFGHADHDHRMHMRAEGHDRRQHEGHGDE